MAAGGKRRYGSSKPDEAGAEGEDGEKKPGSREKEKPEGKKRDKGGRGRYGAEKGEK